MVRSGGAGALAGCCWQVAYGAQAAAPLCAHLAAARVLYLVSQQRGQGFHLSIHRVCAAVHHGQPAAARGRGGPACGCSREGWTPHRAVLATQQHLQPLPMCPPTRCTRRSALRSNTTTTAQHQHHHRQAGTCRGRCSRPSAPPPPGAPPPPWQTPQTKTCSSVGRAFGQRWMAGRRWESCARRGAAATSCPCPPPAHALHPPMCPRCTRLPLSGAPCLAPTRSSRRSFSSSILCPMATRSTPACWQVGTTSMPSSASPGNSADSSSRCRRGHSARAWQCGGVRIVGAAWAGGLAPGSAPAVAGRQPQARPGFTSPVGGRSRRRRRRPAATAPLHCSVAGAGSLHGRRTHRGWSIRGPRAWP